MLVPLTDQQHFSTCWPRVCTVPLEMSICTFACMITQNKKIKTIPSVQQWDLLGMKYIGACASKAMNGAETIDQFCLWESKRKDFFFFAKKKRQNGHHFAMKTSVKVLDFSSWSRFFLYKHDGAAFAGIERHATACVTQIFYIGYCVILDIGPRLSRPSLTHWLITCFLLYLQNL